MASYMADIHQFFEGKWLIVEGFEYIGRIAIVVIAARKGV